MTREETIELIDKTLKDFMECESGDSWMHIDGDEYHTDVGYALEGMDIFVKVLKKRLIEIISEEKQTPEEYKRKLMMRKLSEMPSEVVEIVYLYVVNYIAYGEDVTEKWLTVKANTQALDKAYRKGYYNALKDMKERDKEDE